MALFTTQERIARTAALLESVEASLSLLRQDAEAARDLIGFEEAEISEATRRVGKVEQLVQTLQKMEAKLVEFQDRHFGSQRVRDGELDLDAARLEIGCRLARLRRCRDAGDVS